MTARADLPRLEDLPIPEDVAVGATWPSALREMADYIGAYDTLRIVEALGGEYIYVSRDPERSPFRDILSVEKLALMTQVYGGSRHLLPTGTKELRHARWAGVIAAVRAKTLSGADAARICRTSRTHMAKLVNRTSQGVGASIPGAIPRHRRPTDERQLDMFEGVPEPLGLTAGNTTLS